jgi:predicted alpha/beta superfamily hydrolase
MKRSILPLITVIIIFICINGVQTQTAPTQQNRVFLENTEQFTIESKYVANEHYIIQVGLPACYYHSSVSYPVLYVLDGDKSFGMTKKVTDWLTWSNEIRDIIIVSLKNAQI